MIKIRCILFLRLLPLKKNFYIFLIVITFSGFFLLPSMAQEDRVLGLPEHELGDQVLGMDAGLLLPLFFQDFSGNTASTNLSIGGITSLHWYAYLYPFLRIGLEVGGSFNISPQGRSLLMLPLIAKVEYIFSISRFEFPVSLGFGVNIVRYRDWSQIDISLKPGIGGFWRYDANWSFGAHLGWWWEFQPATRFQTADQARMAHFIQITPALLYHF